jgi:hypothetical protein
MNLLEIVPALESIIGKVIQNPNQATELRYELERLDIQQDIERLKVQQSWLSNHSPFVAGAIPCILWLLSAVVAFNHIIAPLLMGLGMRLPTLELPEYYTNLAGTIILGLFAKKAWDGSEITAIGKKKKTEENGAAKVEYSSRASAVSREDPAYHDKRYEELLSQYRLKDEEK